MKTNRSRKTTPIKVIAIALVAIVLAAGIYGGVAYAQKWWPFLNSENHNVTPGDSNDPSDDTNSVNYDSPTDQEIKDSQDGKKDSSESDTPSPGTQKIEVAVSDASNDGGGNIEVRAFTPSVVEGTGTCTASFTKGTLKVKKSSEAFIDASSSICRPISIALSKFTTKGMWSLTVTYSSPTGTGSSEVIEVEI